MEEKYKYQYILNEFKAINKAEINLSGITVLSGINGCGKSTLSRWLYYLVNEDNQMTDNLVKDYLYWISDKVRQFNYASIDLNRTYGGLTELRYRVERSLDDYDVSDPETLDKAYTIYNNYLTEFSKRLSLYLNQADKGSRRTRLLNFLQLEESNVDTEHLVNSFLEREINRATEEKEKVLQEIEKRPEKVFFNHICSKFSEDIIPKKIQLKENSVSLINKDRINTLFNLNRAIYVDSPMAVSDKLSYDNVLWMELHKLIMLPKKKIKIGLKERKILLRIRKILHGEVVVKKDSLSGGSDLYFTSNDGSQFKLDEAATGFKSFSYIQRLLENGFLNSTTLLLIDEPEAHLHPQWIVEFARILILIHKNLGTKIMVASHNPDMVAAIRAIAKKEQLEEETNFYLAEDNGKGKYDYKALGTDIAPIFSSFNIAIDRINEYGME